MHGFSRLRQGFCAAVLIGGALVVAVPPDVYGDPPPWAPAHGWRKKHDPNYVGYTGKKWDNDYGVVQGSCNREAVGAVVGGVVGAAVGSQIGKGSGRKVAIVVGTIAGAVIGAQVGRDLDRADRGCIGHALELAGDNKRVAWSNPDNGASYRLTPVRGFQRNGQSCREFDLRTTAGGRSETTRSRACQTGEGTWQIVT